MLCTITERGKSCILNSTLLCGLLKVSNLRMFIRDSFVFMKALLIRGSFDANSFLKNSNTQDSYSCRLLNTSSELSLCVSEQGYQ